MKTGLNNLLLPTLFNVVNNIVQHCYIRFRLNSIVQYCCSNVFSSSLNIYVDHFLPCTAVLNILNEELNITLDILDHSS